VWGIHGTGEEGAEQILRGHLYATECKHVVLMLIFLKHISNSFEELRARLITEQAEGANPEDQDEYRVENVFWVPPEARWSHFRGNAKNPLASKQIEDLLRNLGERGRDLLEKYFGEMK